MDGDNLDVADDEDIIYVDLTEEEGDWMDRDPDEEEYFSERTLDSSDVDHYRTKLLNLYLDRFSDDALNSREDLDQLLTDSLTDKAGEAFSIADQLNYDPAGEY